MGLKRVYWDSEVAQMETSLHRLRLESQASGHFTRAYRRLLELAQAKDLDAVGLIDGLAAFLAEALEAIEAGAGRILTWESDGQSVLVAAARSASGVTTRPAPDRIRSSGPPADAGSPAGSRGGGTPGLAAAGDGVQPEILEGGHCCRIPIPGDEAPLGIIEATAAYGKPFDQTQIVRLSDLAWLAGLVIRDCTRRLDGRVA